MRDTKMYAREYKTTVVQIGIQKTHSRLLQSPENEIP